MLSWSPAALPVWALVCGLPAGDRERRQIYMLRAFIDDSRGHSLPKVFVLAGYISTAERWASFSDEWRRALDMSPRIAYFKYWEAIKRRKQFYGWSEKAAFERASVFR